MNKDWSEKNKTMQALIGKEATFREGLEVLFGLRSELYGQISSIAASCLPEAFSEMPFAGADGYHSKTLAYSMWHIFRIEDIVANTLITGEAQVLFTDGWLEKTGSPIITTGNELKGSEIAEFSKRLDAGAVHGYCGAVMEKTNAMLCGLQYKDLKRKFTGADRARIIDSRSVSPDESAVWLIDYWCGKDIRGLIRMPFSRHWIMHIEAMGRIRDGLRRGSGIG